MQIQVGCPALNIVQLILEVSRRQKVALILTKLKQLFPFFIFDRFRVCWQDKNGNLIAADNDKNICEFCCHKFFIIQITEKQKIQKKESQ